MKITLPLIDKLLRLRSGESLPSSALRGDWVEELLRDGVLVSRSQGSRRTLMAADPDKLELALGGLDERLRGLERMRRVLLEAAAASRSKQATDFAHDSWLKQTNNNTASRSEQAAETGNSKLVAARSCPGFPVNAYEPIPCRLNGQEIEVCPTEGSFLFIADWQRFSIPEDVVVVGIENMENFRLIRQQKALFSSPLLTEELLQHEERLQLSRERLLFVSRYPQSTDLRSWLQTIPNRYVHFGDFDLAGINIFLTEFRQHLGDRASFLIPTDIEQRLQNGSAERYREQYSRLRNLTTDIPSVQKLIDLIHRYHRGYDQEGYIKCNKLA